MLSVEDALAQILATATAPLETEWVDLRNARGRTLADEVRARRTQPPAAVSAMDGYAVRTADIDAAPATLRLIGTSAAGRAFDGVVGPGETVRIFTGAPLPAGADTVLMQENAEASEDRITALQSEPLGRHVRPAGLDFKAGDSGLAAGRRLAAAELALAGAMNHPRLPVVRRPRVAILSTGDELVAPGTEPEPAQIVASNAFALAAIVEAAGGSVIDLGIAGDSFVALERAILAAREAAADLLVTLGGASVGDHDLVQSALVRQGMTLGFWQVAMRPGKPLMHGRLGALRVIGLPGNPVSSIVCGVLFVRPLVRALSGDPAAGLPPLEPARLGATIPVNGNRQDFMRATLMSGEGALPVATPAAVQDSSMLRVLAGAQALIVRAAYAPEASAGEDCKIIKLDGLL